MPKKESPFRDDDFWFNVLIVVVIFLILAITVGFCWLVVWAVIKIVNHLTMSGACHAS